MAGGAVTRSLPAGMGKNPPECEEDRNNKLKYRAEFTIHWTCHVRTYKSNGGWLQNIGSKLDDRVSRPGREDFQVTVGN